MFYLKKFFRWHVLAWTVYFGYVVLGGLLLPETFGRNPRISLAQNLWLDASFQVARIATFIPALRSTCIYSMATTTPYPT